MSQLDAGQSATLTVGDGATISIASNGGFAQAVVTPVAGSVNTVQIGPEPQRRVLGPFSEGATVVLTSQSASLIYQPSPGAEVSKGAATNRLVAVGDSWAARLTTEDATGVSAFLDDGPISWAQALSQHKLDPQIPVPALGGTTSTYWRTAIDAVVNAHLPCWFVCFLGINDISADVPLATIQSNLAIVYDKILAGGHKLIVCNVGPYGPTFVPTGANLATKTAQRALLNQWIADYAVGRQNCFFVDTFAAMVSPSNVNGYSLAADADTNGTTGLHPSASGSRKIGTLIAAIINSQVPADPHVHASSYTDSFDYDANAKNRISNPLMLGTGGGNTPGAGTTITPTAIPASWNVVTGAGTATVVCTTAARTVAADGDAIGQNAVLTITDASAADLVSLRTGSIGARFAAGDRVVGEFFIRASNMANVKGIRLLMTTSIGGTSYTRTGMFYADSGGNYLQSDQVIVIKTPEFVWVPGAVAFAILTLDVAFTGAGTCTLAAGRASWRKLN